MFHPVKNIQEVLSIAFPNILDKIPPKIWSLVKFIVLFIDL